jgi:hypothetical protein
VFPVVSYATGNGAERHRVVLVDADEGGFKCVDSLVPEEELIDADFLKTHNQFIFQRVVYLRKAGTSSLVQCQLLHLCPFIL